MAFKGIHNQNPFILPALFFGILLGVRAFFLHRPGRIRATVLKLGRTGHQLLIIAFLLTLALVPVFESYFTVYECAVSSRYHRETIDIAKTSMQALSDANIDYWLDYATLLGALRGQTINHWDHDADFSAMHPEYSLTKPATLARARLGAESSDITPSLAVSQFLSVFTKAGMVAEWDGSRHLIQVRQRTSAGPHIDLWLWTPAVNDDGKLWLWTADHTVHYTPRPATDIFPLANTTWLGVNAAIPVRSHPVSSKEFSVYGGSYLLASVFRGDCFHNFFNFRWMY